MNTIKFAILWLLLLYQSVSVSQRNNIDSLRREIVLHKSDTIIPRLYTELGSEYDNKNPDSALFYYSKAISIIDSLPYPIDRHLQITKSKALRWTGATHYFRGNYQEALNFYFESLELSRILDDKINVAKNLNNIGLIYTEKGQYEKALEFHTFSLETKKELSDVAGIAASYNNLGYVYYCQGIFDKALEFNLQSLQKYEEIGNQRGIANACSDIGNIYEQLKNLELALEFHTKALQVRELISDKRGMARSLNGIGNIYKERREYNKALEYHQKSLKIKEELSDKLGMAHSFGNIGMIYSLKKEFSKAIQSSLVALKTYHQIGEKRGMAETLTDLGIVYEELQNFPKAIELFNQSFALSLEIGAKQQKLTAALRLMQVYEKTGNMVQALRFSKTYISLKDSLNNEEKTKAVAEMSARYETEKKQLQIDNLNKERDLQNEIIARKEIESRNQQIIIVSFAVGFVFIAIFLFFLVRLILQKRRANAVLESQKTQIERQNYVLQQAYEEITTQRDTVMNQKELIEVAHTQLTDSLQYALSIQSALLPTEKAFQRFAQSSFIFMLPRDVVSGDFVWTASVGSNHIFCVADCTGHGVPGAFMSVLGISALNEIVVHQHITEPVLILEKLRNNVIEALKQNSSDVLHKDGLDIALCTYDENSQELLFSGARIPLWIVMENQNATELPDGTTKITNPENNLVLVNFKPNAMPIGISPKMKPFTQNSLLLKNTNAILYLATDGFGDQFGERERKKFQSKNLQQLLLKNAGLPLTEQNQLLRETFSEWRHHAEQIDDVTILGLKL